MRARADWRSRSLSSTDGSPAADHHPGCFQSFADWSPVLQGFGLSSFVPQERRRRHDHPSFLLATPAPRSRMSRKVRRGSPYTSVGSRQFDSSFPLPGVTRRGRPWRPAAGFSTYLRYVCRHGAFHAPPAHTVGGEAEYSLGVAALGRAVHGLRIVGGFVMCGRTCPDAPETCGRT
jgi:hypothetical protein